MQSDHYCAGNSILTPCAIVVGYMIVLSTHAEVTAALREPSPVLDTATRQLRDEAHELFTGAQLDRWAHEWDPAWQSRFEALPKHFDLIADLAVPMGRQMAAQVCDIDDTAALRLAPLARELFDAESDPANAALATSAMMSVFHDSLKVQAFAALCHTLPAFLGNAWYALLKHPVEMERLAYNPEILPGAIEELLRFAGPSLAVFRTAANGERIKLELSKANRDPAVFTDPGKANFKRSAAGHVAFGAGPHACVGAALIRRAAKTPILLFAQRFTGRTVSFRPEPIETNTLRSMQNFLMRTS